MIAPEGERCRSWWLVAGIVLAALVVGPGGCRWGAHPESVRDLGGELELARTGYVEAFNGRDARALTALFTTDAQLLPPGHPAVDGRAAILEFWQEALRDEAAVLRLVPSASRGVGVLAWESGAWTVGAAAGPTFTGKYLMVWRRMGNDWRILREMWNEDPRSPEPTLSPEPMPAPTATGPQEPPSHVGF